MNTCLDVQFHSDAARLLLIYALSSVFKIFIACPTNCKGGYCNSKTGDCSKSQGCNPGFYGSRCDIGRFGKQKKNLSEL